MEWLIPDTSEEMTSRLADRSEAGGPTLATGAPAPAREARTLPGAADATVVSTARLAGEPDVRPGDLTVIAEAGLRVADLQRELAGRGLWLALGGPASRASVGGAVALGGAGPWDLSFGDLSRQLLACELTTWQGTPARWGRAVMKDVAGYGTTRAVVGSFDRLGVLRRAAFRVWPAPEAATALELATGGEDPLELAGRAASSDLEAAVRPDALVWRRAPDRDPDVDRLEAWLVGPESSVAVRRERLGDWLEKRGGAVTGERADFDPISSLDGAGRTERDPGVSVVVLRPGRKDFEAVARAADGALGGASMSTTGYPLAGVLRCTYRRVGGGADEGEAGEPRPLADLAGAVGETPVRVERGSAPELAFAAGRRPEALRRLERRVIEALEGRRRHWLSGYL